MAVTPEQKEADKVRRAAREKARRAADPEKAREKARVRRAANPEKYQQQNRDWYAAHADQHCARRRARRTANLEEERARCRAWLAINAGWNRERVRAWAQANKVKKRAANQRRRAACTTDVREAPTAKQMAEILLDPCLYCGAPAEHVDHFIPLSRGGTHTWHNLVPACAACNLSKGAKLPDVEWTGRKHRA